jgi:hypothetical protein
VAKALAELVASCGWLIASNRCAASAQVVQVEQARLIASIRYAASAQVEQVEQAEQASSLELQGGGGEGCGEG